MKRVVFLAGILALMVMVGPASAVVFLDFGTGTAGAGGTITATATTASGSAIRVDTLTVTGVSAAVDGTYDLFGTGGNGTTDNGYAVLDFNTSGNPAPFHIVGGVCQLGFVNCNTTSTPNHVLVASETLATGTGAVSSYNASVRTSTNLTMAFQEPDTKATDLLTALGIPTSTSFALMSATFQGVNAAGTGLTAGYTVNSTDVDNTGTPVPEPTSILLLGSVLIGLTSLVRRRSKKA